MLWSLSLAQYAAMPVLPAIAPDIAAWSAAPWRTAYQAVSPFGRPDCFDLIPVAAWLQVRLRNFQRRAKMDLVAADLAKSFKKALLTGAAEGAVVLKSRGREQQYYGEGKALYDSCLDGPKPAR
jgi:hypothetical protein